MQSVLYIGQFQPGTTSYARGCALKELLPQSEFTFIDTLRPFHAAPRLFRSIGFRWKTGPLVTRINQFVRERVVADSYDLVWVDKAVFLTESTTSKLRQVAGRLVHFTPDPAFKFHQSRHFENSLGFYDLAITTKSYEIDDYISRLGVRRVLLVTQGYEPSQHYPRKPFRERIPGVCFIGHHEKQRQRVLEAIMGADVPVFIAGRGWERFARQNNGNRNLVFGGIGVYGDAYAERLSEYQFGLGMLSKWVPEKHTTRTFEIPACGTILVTERNSETSSFFADNEAFFYDSTPELLERLAHLLNNYEEAASLANGGLRRVMAGGYDYKSIIAKALAIIYGPS